jgi:hypothetical protein
MTGDNPVLEKVDQERLAFGNYLYKPELHNAIAHMRRWDGACQLFENCTVTNPKLFGRDQSRSLLS